MVGDFHDGDKVMTHSIGDGCTPPHEQLFEKAAATIEEAIQEPGIYKCGEGLGVHFSPYPNWYVCVLGFNCPRCDEAIAWEWIGQLPPLTNPALIKASGVFPQMVQGARLDTWGHRWIQFVCNGCSTLLSADNFDRAPEGA